MVTGQIDACIRSAGEIIDILGKNRLRSLGFIVAKGKVTARQAVLLNRVGEELPSTSDVANVDDIELQEITENDIEKHGESYPATQGRILHGLTDVRTPRSGKQLRSIRGSLKVEVVKKVQLKECIKKEKRKLEEIRDNSEYDDGIRKDIRHRFDKLNDDLSFRQKSINLPKDRLINQITSFKETIAKVPYKDTSLAKKIRTLFHEQGIMITSILTAIGMAIGVLIEALLPDGGGGGGTMEAGVQEWVINKLKALARLLGRLGVKAEEALPGIIGAIIS